MVSGLVCGSSPPGGGEAGWSGPPAGWLGLAVGWVGPGVGWVGLAVGWAGTTSNITPVLAAGSAKAAASDRSGWAATAGTVSRAENTRTAIRTDQGADLPG
ncbi:hypothetical protein GA0070216_12074 [Micromonospora matsumotoense]|uniref:Uncharacterized protein n=1 Tax=Micromonospora matsumotoense TaxID=121616 RepID=A0A1C5ANT2_9ACTN|nr:hypothetical protein GA0070216_12074 [Micromonospora matsumotoense]